MKNLILLHGALGAKSQLHPIAEKLSSYNNVFTLNFQGHGGHPSTSKFSIELFSNDLITFMDENRLEKADIFGYSMGGYVALKTAFNNPERIGKIITLGTKFDWTPEKARQEVKMLDPEKIEEKVPKFAAYLKELHHPNDWKELLRKTADMMLQLGNEPALTDEEFRTIQHECLVGLGDKDEMVSARETIHVAELIPNGSFYTMKDTPHPIDRIDQAKIINKIREFI